jgi:hypothetical protein
MDKRATGLLVEPPGYRMGANAPRGSIDVAASQRPDAKFVSTSPLPPSPMSAPLVSRIFVRSVLQARPSRATHRARRAEKLLWSNKEWLRFMGTPHRAWQSVCTIGAETRNRRTDIRQVTILISQRMQPPGALHATRSTWICFTCHDHFASSTDVCRMD